jgi:hypothetical protein
MEQITISGFGDIFTIIPGLISMPSGDNNCGFYSIISMRKDYDDEQMELIGYEELEHEIAGLRMIIKSEPGEKIDSEQFFELVNYLRLERIAVLSYFGFESSSFLEYPFGKKCKYLACIICGHFYILTNPTKSLNMLKKMKD